MEKKSLKRLKTIRLKNQKNINWTNRDLYRLFYKQDFYLLAYQRLKIKNKTKYLDFDIKIVRCLILKLRNQSFQFLLKNQEKISGKNNIEKEIVKELIIIILENVYQPCFLNVKLAYRFSQSKDKALIKLKKNFSEVNWINKNHESQDFFKKSVFIKFLNKKIEDISFINLVLKYLKSINIENFEIKDDLNLLLINIYFYEFDRFIESLNFIPDSSCNDRFQPLNVAYIRYAQKWIIGLKNSKAVSEKFPLLVESFLKKNYSVDNLKMEKVDFKNQSFSYFNYLVSIRNCSFSNMDSFERRNKKTIEFLIPISKLIFDLYLKGLCTSEGYPIPKRNWTIKTDELIVTLYNKILQKLLLEFKKADRKRPFLRIQYILQYSCAMTLAHKHKTTISKVFLKHGKKLEVKNLNKSYCINLLTISNLKKLR